MVAISEDQITVGKVLGEGNFGKVFAGEYFYEHGKKVSERDCRIDPWRFRVGAQVPVALKAIKATNDPRSKDDMKKEAFVMKELSHPCIVRLYGICQSRKLGSTLMVLIRCARWKGSLTLLYLIFEWLARKQQQQQQHVLLIFVQDSRCISNTPTHTTMTRRCFGYWFKQN